MGTGIILNQLLILGILIVFGVIFAKCGIITENMKEALSRIIIDVTLPFLILSTFVKMEFTHDLLWNSGLVILLTLANLAFLHLMGAVSSRLLKLNIPDTTVHTLHTMFGNIVFLGFPILDALFPNGVGVFYGAVYQLASNTITFTYGIYKLSAGTQKSGIKSLLNLNSGALAIGILIMALGIELPTQLTSSLSSIGKCTSPLSMIYIGALLAGMNFSKTLKRPSVYAISMNKLIIAPLILAFVYHGIINWLGLNFSHEAFIVVVMQAAMPCQTIVVVMSKRYGGSFDLATANLFVSTLLSIVTLPLLYRFLCWLI